MGMGSVYFEVLRSIHRLLYVMIQLDRRTRKLMKMHNALHPKSNSDRLYIPRKEGGKGMESVKETINVTNLGLENYVKESGECLLTTTRSVDVDLIEPI